MASDFMERLRARPQPERNAIFLASVSVLYVIVGVVVLVLTPKTFYVGLAFFAAAVLQLGFAAWNWSRRDA